MLRERESEGQDVHVSFGQPGSARALCVVWQKESPASPENLRKSAGLPPKSKSMARARLREGAPVELPWAGGRAGTKR